MVIESDFQFSDEEKLYPYKKKLPGGGECMVIHGVEGEVFDEITGYSYERHSSFEEVEASFINLPDGNVSYYGRKKDKWFVVVGGFKDGPYDYIDIKRPVIFSPHTGRYAYKGVRGNNTFIVIDGIKSEPFDSATDPVISSDGGKVAFSAKQENRSFAVINNIPREYINSNVSDIKFSPDGTRTAFCVSADYIRINENTIDTVKNSMDPEKVKFLKTLVNKIFLRSELTDRGFSFDDIKAVNYSSLMLNNRGFMLIDGIEGEPFHEVSILDFTFSPDSRRYAYRGRTGDEWFLVLDGVKRGPYQLLYNINFSSDSRRIAWKIKEGDKCLAVIDSIKEKPYDNLFSSSSFNDIIFSPDSTKVALCAVNYEKDSEGFLKCKYCGGKIAKGWFEVTGETMEKLKYKLPSKKLEAIEKLRGQKFSSEKELAIALKDLGFDGEDRYFISTFHYYTRQDPAEKCKAMWWHNEKCSPEEKIYVVVNGVESPPFTSVSEPAFSPDSRSFTYRAKRGKEEWQNWSFDRLQHNPAGG